MPRFQFGAGISDFVVRPDEGVWKVAAETPVTFWSAPVEGSQYTDLLSGNGDPVTSVSSDPYGALPEFYGPPNVAGMWADAGGTRAWISARPVTTGALSKGMVFPAPAGAVSYVIWRAPAACTVTAVSGYRQGGTGATVNATKNGADLLTADLSLSTDTTWLSGPALQNTAVAAGDSIALAVRSVSGAVGSVTVQIDVQGL